MVLLFFSSIWALHAQYFGRYKPGYKKFDYKVYETPNFEIYHYFKNDTLIHHYAILAEKWYDLHSIIFQDEIEKKNPLLLYSNHADFQQTNAVSSIISVGTGGVTEVLKNRVVMPVSFAYSQTDHVLGHELVHAFQFNLLVSGEDSTNTNSLRNLPLWMVEGMAEYMSIGSVDANTAMWIRDALINDYFPTLEDLNKDPRYFPYRYGQSFWSMVTKKWGDDVIRPLFSATAKFGYKRAIDSVLGISPETFSGMWKSANENYYKPFLKDSVEAQYGNKILFAENAGEVNVSPSISPDGKYVIFLSEKDLFSLDLYLAEANTGEIIKKISSTVHRNEIDAFNYLESSGTWSPDSKQFAFVVFSKGINKLVIVDVEKAKIVRETEIKHVPSFSNPAWSPDGSKILFTGLVDGVPNLYIYHLENGKINQLTHDLYSYLMPQWSPNGEIIVFATDKNPGKSLPAHHFNIGLIDLSQSKRVNIIDVFHGANNLNPVFSSDNKNIYFLSDRDGFRNLYRYNLDSSKTYQLTEFITGISGITPFSPAISISRNKDMLTYSHYFNGEYSIYQAEADDFMSKEVSADDINMAAAVLPPEKHMKKNIIDNELANHKTLNQKSAYIQQDENLSDKNFKEVPYNPKFKLTYISNVQAGVGFSRFGTGMAGSVNALFSDITGDNQLYTSLSINGEVYDFGGIVGYMNKKSKIDWGMSLSHIPYRSLYINQSVEKLPDLDSLKVIDLTLDYSRLFEDKISVYGIFPLSLTQRFEARASHGWYYYRIDRFHTYYDYNYGYTIGQEREKLDAPDGFTLQQINFAHVTDNSFFGLASPLRGQRSRVEIEKYFGKFNFFSGLLDYRKYIFFNPLSFATRVMHQGRYGWNDNSQLMYPLYLGYPWYIRGYESSYSNPNEIQEGYVYWEQLLGSKVIVANAELRMPFSGPERLALIKSRFLPTELSVFMDAGLAWYSNKNIQWKWETDNKINVNTSEFERIPVFSTGASLRINLFGYMVFEPYLAFPFQRGGFKNPTLGLNIMPGW